jgi:hypothetical protein
VSVATQTFRVGLRVLAILASRTATARLARRVAGFAGDFVARRRCVTPAVHARAAADAWRRTFPTPEHHPVVRSDATTAYAEIHTRCPLRGTGNLEACWHLMAYDRAIASRAGARFVVIASQASPGVTVCQVALRSAGLPADDLVPAHLVSRRGAR